MYMNVSKRVAMFASAAILALTPASALNSWNGYHWAGDGSNVTIKVNTAITSQWDASVGGSISDWNASNELTLNAQTVSVSAKRCNPIAGQILVCNYTYGRRGWLGIATIWLQSGTKHITQATTKLNDSYHNSPPYNTDPWRELVACQEIGHDFGLDHQDETFNNVNLGTCMDYTNAPAGGVYNGFNYGPANEHPNKDDYDTLTAVYNHDDGYTTATASTNFGLRQVGRAVPQTPPSEGIGDSPAEWGRAIHSDALGRPDVFLKDFGGGVRALTHVFWAPGERPQ
jgi:hypothetical protein